jgi:hypothetical protein
MTSQFKVAPAYFQQRMDEARRKLAGSNKPLRETFVAQTVKIATARRGNYLRFGPYWFAVKRILRAHGHDLGRYEVKWLADEFAVKDDAEQPLPEETLMAAWIYAEDNGMAPSAEIEIDGIVFDLRDEDM